MPAFEEQLTEFRCTVIHSSRRFIVTLPHKHHYTVEEVLRELPEVKIDFCSTSVRSTDLTVEHGSVIDLVCQANVHPANIDPSELRCTVIVQGCRFTVTLPYKHYHTVEEVRRMIQALPDCSPHVHSCWVPRTDMIIEDGDVIQFNPNPYDWRQRGYRVETTNVFENNRSTGEKITVFQDGRICYVIQRPRARNSF
jgi:hypothetical protein